MEEEWERPQYEAGGGDASVLFVVFGPKPEPLRITSLAHRVVPMDLSLELEYQQPHVAAALLDSPFGATLLQGWEGEEPSVLTADGAHLMRTREIATGREALRVSLNGKKGKWPNIDISTISPSRDGRTR